MQVVIIEDEEFAARRLERMIYQIDAEIKVVAKLESVNESVEWLKNEQQPDLIFMDIHLEDNSSFTIFNSVSINCPIVFTTATNEKSTVVFQENNLDYLLKPICGDELKQIISKYQNFKVKDWMPIDVSIFRFIKNN